MHAIDTVIAAMAALALVMVLLTQWLRTHWINEPLLAALLGVAVGPQVLGWFDLAHYGDPRLVLEVAARFTLALALAVVGLEIRSYLRQHGRSVGVLVFGGAALMWVTSSLIVGLILSLPFRDALLLGAVLTPIDPILTATVTTSSIARETIPEQIRQMLTTESSGRHGIGLVMVLLPVSLLTQSEGDAWTHWLVDGVLWDGVAAIAIGVATGTVVGHLHRWSLRHRDADMGTGPLVSLLFALGLALGSSVELLGSDSVLAVLAASIGFAWTRTDDQEATRLKQGEWNYEEVLKLIVQVPVFFLFGTALPWSDWETLGWKAPALIVAIVVARRLPVIWLLRPFVRDLRSGVETLFVGWFGPVGIGALYFAAVADHETGHPVVWPVTTLLVAAHLVIHNLTVAPLGHWLAAQERTESPSNGE